MRRREDAKSPWLLLAGASFLTLTVVLLLLIAVNRPYQALAGTAIVLAGVPVYAVIERSRPRTT